MSLSDFEKECATCGETKNGNHFPIHGRSNKTSAPYFGKCCKKCLKKKNQEKYAATRKVPDELKKKRGPPDYWAKHPDKVQYVHDKLQAGILKGVIAYTMGIAPANFSKILKTLPQIEDESEE